MNWLLLFEIIYILLVIGVCIRVIHDTQSSTKSFAYLLAVIFLPFIGMIIYFAVGINYRKRKIYSKRIFSNEKRENELIKKILTDSNAILADGPELIKNYEKLSLLILNKTYSPITNKNKVCVLQNGENKFPKVFEAIENAINHIHIEYYIFNADTIGCKIIDLLIKKAGEGVKVRLIYDDFGSREIRKKQVARLLAAGVEAFPFYKVKIITFANRLNYRNHRKIIIVDGTLGFVGGINISDKYINSTDAKNAIYWRDTHLMIHGPAVTALQKIFNADCNYRSGTL